MSRPLYVLIALLGCIVLMSARVIAADAKEGTHEGVVVSATADKLHMSDKEGKNEHTHNVGATATITLDGKKIKLADLKKGDTVKITIEKLNDKLVVTKVDAK